MADTKKISELNSTSNLANEDEFVVIDKNGTGADSSSSGKTSKIRFDALKNQIGSQGEKGQKGEANKGQKGEAEKGQKGEASKGQKGEASKGQKGEPLEFNDLSSTQRTSLKGQKGLEGAKLTFNDLSSTERTSLKGQKGEASKGEKGEPLKFNELSSTEKTSLKGAPGPKLTFNDLTSAEKTSLKGAPGATGKFGDLTTAEKTSLKGQKGEENKGQKGEANKGQKGEVDAYASAKSLYYWNANTLVGKSADVLYKTAGGVAWDAGAWSKKSHKNGASISFKVGSRMYAKKPIFIIGFNSSSNKSEPAPGTYFDYGIYYHGVNNKLYAKKGTSNSVDRTLPTNGGTFTLTYDAKNVRLYVDNALWFTWNTDLDKTFSMKASLYSPVNPNYTSGGNSYFDPIVHDLQFSPYGASGDDGQKGEPGKTLKFTDLTSAEKTSLKGAPGAAGPNDITNKAITSNATSSWTGNPGTQGKIQYHSARWYIVSDKSSNRIVQFRRDGADKSYIDNNGKFIGTATFAESAMSAGNSVKLDGLPVTSFVRTNATSNVSADTEWQDNKSIYLGNSADYRIYHNSNNHTYFQNRNHGTGTYFQSENSAGTNVGHLYLEGGARPYVRLLESGSERLRTTSTGVKITGGLEVTGQPQVKAAATIVFTRVQTNLQASESNSFEDIETIDDTSEQYILGGNNDGDDDDDDDDYVAPIYRTTLTTKHKIGFKSVTQSGNTATLKFDTPVANGNKITVNVTKGSSINWIPYVSSYDMNGVTVAFPGSTSAWTFPLHISVFY